MYVYLALGFYLFVHPHCLTTQHHNDQATAADSPRLLAATGVWTGLIILRFIEENLDIRLVFLQGGVQRQLEDRDRVLWLWWKHLCSVAG